MYSRFILILKFLQLVGYVLAIIYSGWISMVFSSSNSGFVLLGFAALFCFWNYIVTQTLIAIIDILNQIEINTRNPRR